MSTKTPQLDWIDGTSVTIINPPSRSGYTAGQLNRGNKAWWPKPESGDTPSWQDVSYLRSRLWDLYRNNMYARKLVRAWIATHIGCGLKLESMAVDAKGEPADDFRKIAKDVWESWCDEADATESIENGGSTFDELSIIALLEVGLSGMVLTRHIYGDDDGRKDIPYGIELIEVERLAETSTFRTDIPKGHYIHNGIEFDQNGKRVAYHLYQFHPQDPRSFVNNIETKRIPAGKIVPLFRKYRPDQQFGYPELATIPLQLHAVGDYQDDELMAAAVSCCIAMGIVRKSGSGPFGLATPVNDDSTDDDGNVKTRLQPGMLLDLREGEDIKSFNPMRPNANAESFSNHMLRGVAGGAPGIKASTVTGDYRNSSFSSEKSADNDCWREVEQVQEWLCKHFHCPIYRRVIDMAVKAGKFDGMDFRGFRYIDNRKRFLRCDWNGPVAKSINPTDDATASDMNVASGRSCPQVEAANMGTQYKENVDKIWEAYKYAKDKGLPEAVCLKLAGFDPTKVMPQEQKPGANGNGKPQRWIGRNGEDLSRGMVHAEN